MGFLFAAALFGIFGVYVHRPNCELTPTVAYIFGGGLLFCGILIDYDHILGLIQAWRGR